MPTGFIRYVGRCLCPSDAHKLIVGLSDSLDRSPGNSAKSTLLSWVQSAMSFCSCTLESAHVLTVGRGHKLTENHCAVDGPVLRLFDELTAGQTSAEQINCSQLKFLTSGRKGQAAIIVAANTNDWPDLHRLGELDPAFVRRLGMLPARARFYGVAEPETCSPVDCLDIHQTLDELSPALAKLLLDAWLEYKQAGSKLLPMPTCMQHF